MQQEGQLTVVRGSALRALRVLGTMAIVVTCLFALSLKFCVTDVGPGKAVLVTSLAMIVAFIVIVVTVVAAFTVARVDGERLRFTCCGLRMRAFRVDGTLNYELQHIGRMEILVIRQGRVSYVPNGALSREELLNLLRSNGIAQLNAADR